MSMLDAELQQSMLEDAVRLHLAKCNTCKPPAPLCAELMAILRRNQVDEATLTKLGLWTREEQVGEPPPKVHLVAIQICQACLDGEDEECHTPGCALFLHAVDLPIHEELYRVIEGGWPELETALHACGEVSKVPKRKIQ